MSRNPAAAPGRDRRAMLLGALATLAFLAVTAAVVAAAGVYDVAASREHLPPVRAAIEFGLRRAVATYSAGVEVPRLDDEGLVRLGAGHFASGCAPCHGAPGEPRAAIPSRMLPAPPPLADAAPSWGDAELFWIVSNGLKFTGMPAWPGRGRDDEVWALVAFLRVLPGLDAERYRALAGIEGRAVPAGLAALAGADARDSCGRCHDDGTRPPASRLVPALAGLPAGYLAAQLRDYAAGRRPSGFMQPVAAALDGPRIERLAAAYASLPAVRHSAGPAAPERLERGEALVTRGLPARALPPCLACHRDGARAIFPPLAGRSAEYLAGQLRVFRRGLRESTGAGAIMTAVARRIPDELIDDVALYLESRGGEAARR